MEKQKAVPLRHRVERGGSLNHILRQELHISGTQLKRLKRSGGIFRNGAPARTDEQAQPGDELLLLLENDGMASPGITPQAGELAILYEDAHLLIVDKPAGMPVHPGPGHADGCLANYVLGHYAAAGGPGVFRAVNRLDRSTSGVMLVARTAWAQDMLRAQRLTRLYLALVHGTPPELGVISAPIQKENGPTIRRSVHPDSTPASTAYRRLAATRGYSLMALAPRTGRTHQIRVHMAWLGHPLAGDFLYGREEALIPRHALHSAALALVHPVTGQPLILTAPLPADMARALTSLEIAYSGEAALYAMINAVKNGGIL